jgi:stress response protein YsnF
MTDAIKFTEEELKSLQNLQLTYNQLTMALGQLTVSNYALKEREETLKAALLDTRTKETELAKELTEKYGKGSLNIENGEFTPETTLETPAKALAKTAEKTK